MVNFTKLAVAAVAATGATAQDSMKQSICDKYTIALLKNNTAANQYTLLTLLVKTAALGSFTGPGTQLTSLPGSMVKVPGILAPGEAEGQKINLMPYFTGELASSNVNDKPTAVNWLDADTKMLVSNATYVGENGSKSKQLLTHLFSYFGAALGCSTYGQMGFPAYMGDKSQTNVHKFMSLNHAQNTWFIQQVGLAAKSFGASDDDIKAVATLLENTFNQRCSPAAEVIPSQGKQQQAICLDASCPTATNADCGSYPTNIISQGLSAVPKGAAAATPTGATMSNPSGAAGNSPSTRAGGTPGASTASSTAPAQATRTGAAAANVIPAGLAGAAALAALVL